MNVWHINEETFDPNPKRLHSQETVYTIGNGYFATRGTFEEGYPKDNPATLLFGVFDDIPVAREELANIPDWTSIKLFVNGERFRLDQGTILGYRRSLDLYNGVLRRSVHWQSPQGVRLSVSSERFASLANEHVGAIRYSVRIDESVDQLPVDITLRASFNIAQGNYDVMHWDSVAQGHDGDLLWLESETKKTQVTLAQTMSFTTQHLDTLQKEFVDSDVAPSIRFYGTINPGTTLSVEKIVVMYTSRDTLDPLSNALAYHHALLVHGTTQLREPDIHRALSVETEPTSTTVTTSTGSAYERLLREHEQAWHSFWEQADILIEGDDRAQLAIRYNVYQLRINVNIHDSRYSIAAKGLTGFGYRGHIFHDTEIFMLPFFTYIMPEVARNLLLYRYHLLPAARKKAASNGYEGAQYPWESTLNGEETTPSSIIHPETGEVIPVLNGLIELHISASIAYAVAQYWKVTADAEFMRDYGTEILVSTAQFWVSRAEKHPARGDYEITDVIGPDEWHEHVNNNAYTNYMARWNIRQALTMFTWLQAHYPSQAQQLQKRLGLTPEALAHWHDVATHLRIPQDPRTLLFEQFDGFLQLEQLDQSQFQGRKDSYQAILGIEGVQKYQIIKQADVLMLLTVLDDEFDLRTKKVNWDYYYPITDHDYGSSLTPALHAILACELGHVEEGYALFLKGAFVDLDNLRGNTPEGIHAACAGAVWQATIFGFAGLRVTPDGYRTHPSWPRGWRRLAFTFKYHGQVVHVDLHQ